jgi:hypothetical protein
LVFFGLKINYLATLVEIAPRKKARKLLFLLMIVLRVARFFLAQCTKIGENIPNRTKLSNGPNTDLPNDSSIFQMATDYINLLHSKAVQNLPKLGFLV